MFHDSLVYQGKEAGYLGNCIIASIWDLMCYVLVLKSIFHADIYGFMDLWNFDLDWNSQVIVFTLLCLCLEHLEVKKQYWWNTVEVNWIFGYLDFDI